MRAILVRDGNTLSTLFVKAVDVSLTLLPNGGMAIG
jgi:hypothetical protein